MGRGRRWEPDDVLEALLWVFGATGFVALSLLLIVFLCIVLQAYQVIR